MAKKEPTVRISIANTDTTQLVPISEAREWEPKKKANISNFMHFHNGDHFVSMSIKDFNTIYADKK